MTLAEILKNAIDNQKKTFEEARDKFSEQANIMADHIERPWKRSFDKINEAVRIAQGEEDEKDVTNSGSGDVSGSFSG